MGKTGLERRGRRALTFFSVLYWVWRKVDISRCRGGLVGVLRKGHACDRATSPRLSAAQPCRRQPRIRATRHEVPAVNSALVPLPRTKFAPGARPTENRRLHVPGPIGEARFFPENVTQRPTIAQPRRLITPPAGRPGQPQPPTRLVPAPLGSASPLKNGGGRRQFRESNPAGLLFERPRRARNCFDPPRPTPLSRKSCAEEQPGNAENISPSNYAPPWLNQHHGAAEAPRRRQYRLSDGRYLAPPLRRRVSRLNCFSWPLPPCASSPSCAIPIPNSPEAFGTKG